MKSGEFKCEHCGLIFRSSWSDEEAREEAKQWSDKEMAGGESVVCDDCYKKFMRWLDKNPEIRLN